MLVLSRKVGQKIVLGDQVTITINRISGQRVSIGIVAPPGVRVIRSELDAIESPSVGGSVSPIGFSDPDDPGSMVNNTTAHPMGLHYPG